MDKNELAERIRGIVDDSTERVVGPIASDYRDSADTRQAFEDKSGFELVEMAREELLDFINYSCMLIIKLDQFKEDMDAIGKHNTAT